MWSLNRLSFETSGIIGCYRRARGTVSNLSRLDVAEVDEDDEEIGGA
jgi:hypothetical protein